MTLLSIVISALWIAVFWIMSRDRSDTMSIAMVGALASLVAVGLAVPAVWSQLAAGYPQDSLWTLGWGGRAGVAVICAAGLALIFAALTWKTRLVIRLKTQATSTAWLLIDLALGLLTFSVVYSTSPQIFYSFYRMIIPGLPQQWVIDGVLDIQRLKMITQIDPGGSLADHIAGVAFWAIVPFTLWLHLRNWWRGTH